MHTSSLKFRKATSILQNTGLALGYHLEVGKYKLWWPIVDTFKFFKPRSTPDDDRILLHPLPHPFLTEETAQAVLRLLLGIKLHGAPLGTDAYVAKFLRARTARIDVLLSAVAELNDPNISMHMDRPGDINVTTEAGCSERGYTSAAFDFTDYGAIPDNGRSSAH